MAYIPKTRVERISYTVEFLPIKLNIPNLSYTNTSIRSAKDLIRALKNPTPASLIVTLVNAYKEALSYLANIFFIYLPIKTPDDGTAITVPTRQRKASNQPYRTSEGANFVGILMGTPTDEPS